ncbi:MAG: S-methyl-5-thioribose-1-phosphate isomerase [Deltaproteobacteria bacterium]|nr:S-methyl-5-thioribose-1-phosphate isomerase [Deltaproteobacteria bacterium]
MSFTTIEWTDDAVIMIDQRLLPTREVYVKCRTYQEVAEAIREMIIRGAPAIGVAAAMGIALGAKGIKAGTFEEFYREYERICDHLAGTRPTAVNLFWAVDRMKRFCLENKKAGIERLKVLIKEEALRIHKEDLEINRNIGKNGSPLIPNGARILTHCNAGGLATAGYGTALGVIRAAHEAGKEIEVFADETRPFLQGARLTAWELMKDHIPVTLITDNMAGYFMKKGMIDLVIVGADRIAANGDTANKIGTYSVAVLAREHNIPFYVAAPISTLDLSMKSGDEIPIEERNKREVTHVFETQIAPDGVKVLNPAFDVTPNRYIKAIITEKGVVEAPFDEGLKGIAGKG